MPVPDLNQTPGGPDPDVAAAELALGLLEGEERAAALRRQLAEPEFAREVERWRVHFGTLFAGTPERAPPARVAERIEAHLDRPLLPASRGPAPFWRPLALASSLVAAGLAGVLVLRPGVTPAPMVQPLSLPTQPMVAALARTGKGTPLAAYYDVRAQIVRMPAPMPIPQGRSAQLWAISDGKPPVPLGLFRVVGSTVIADAKMAAAMKSGTVLAISFEPIGGSPTGQPTGPVVASGTLSRV